MMYTNSDKVVSICNKLKKAHYEGKRDEEYNENLEYVEKNLPQAVVNAFKVYKYDYDRMDKSPKEAVEAVEKYLLEESVEIEDILDLLKEKLKGKRISQKHLQYDVFDSEKLESIIKAAYACVEITPKSKRILDLMVKLAPVETIRSIVQEHGDIESFDFETLEKKFNVSKMEFLAWEMRYTCNLGSYIIRYSGKHGKEIISKILKDREENPEILKEALEYLEPIYRNPLYYEVLEITGDEYYEKKCLHKFHGKFEEFLRKNLRNDNKEVKDAIKAYALGNLKFKDVKKYIDKEFKNDISDCDISDSIMYFPEKCQKSVLKLMLYLGEYSVVKSGLYRYVIDIKRGNIEDFIEFLLDSDMDTSYIVDFLASCSIYAGDFKVEGKNVFALGLLYLEKKKIDIFNNIKEVEPDARAFVISVFYNDLSDSVSYIGDSLQYLKDKSKFVRETLVENLSNVDYVHIKDNLDSLKKYLNSKKKDVRMSVIEVLANYTEEKEVEDLLKEILDSETDPKNKDILMEALKIDIKSVYADENGEFDVLSYVTDSLVNLKSNNVTILFEKFTKIRYKNKDEYLDDKIIEYFILSYMTSEELKINRDALLIAESMNKEDLAEFAKDILDYWLENGASIKEKWICLLSSIHGDYNMIKKFNTLIREFCQKSRHKMAGYLIKVLALNGSNEALIVVDAIGRKFKYKSVREGAVEAFDLVAEEYNISMEELQDKIVGDLGFNNLQYVEYDYGIRKFKVYLNDELKFEIEKEDGRIVKTLPKSGVNDDEDKVKNCKDEFKKIKKELKDLVKTQSERLECALVDFRTWNKESWGNLFMKNPVMYRLGKKILWGLYEGDNLVKSFVYDDDFYDINEDTIELNEECKIGVVHPIELSQEEKETWKEIFEGLEIEELFPQINREVYVNDDEDIDVIKDFKGKCVSEDTLIYGLRNKNWELGSVADGAEFSECYKENFNLGIGVQISFDSICAAAIGYHTKIDVVEFYQSGTVERGSYVYDCIDGEERIKPCDVPKRYFSEMMYDIHEVLQSEE